MLFCSTFLCLLGITLCGGKSYTPCELAVELYKVVDSNMWRSLTDKIPLFVCVAGYHQYDSRTGTLSKDYNGIFGLPRDPRIERDYNQDDIGLRWYTVVPLIEDGTDLSYNWHNLTTELDIFGHEVLTVDPNLEFFEHICSGSYVETETCNLALSHYVVSAFEVPVPTDPTLLNKLRFNHLKLESFNPLAPRNGYGFRTSTSWYWQTVGTIITFWTAGLILVGITAFGYHYVRTKLNTINVIVN
uniref:SEC14-like protein 5 n=1 Tax=Lygus hesperus TaxID=30085 RepID=A0A0A9W0B4_LYGHE